MATLLDASILSHFGSIFVIILMFAILFGIMEVTNPFGKDKKGLHALIALVVALLFLVSRSASALVSTMVPWFIVIVVFIFFVMLMFRMFGVDDKTFKDVVGNSSVYPWIIIFSLLVLIGSLSAVFGQSLLESGGGGNDIIIPDDGYSGSIGNGAGYGTTSTSTDNFGVNVMNTMRNPKVLGMLFIFLVGAFLMMFLTRAPNIGK